MADIDSLSPFDIVLRNSGYEGNYIVSDDKAVGWRVENGLISDVDPTKNITILNETYELDYLESARLPLNGYLVHTYQVKGYKYAKVLFSADTGKIVEYVNIPIKVTYSTETEYVELIKKILGEDCDIDEFKYNKCTTWHYVFSEKGMSSTVENGFHICGENEEWRAYSFYYDKYIDGIKTIEHITAEFFDGKFSMEMYDFDYEKEQFTALIDKTPAFNDNIGAFLNSKASKDYVMTKFDVIGQEFFIRNGLPYVRLNVDAKFTMVNEKDELIQYVELLIGFFEDTQESESETVSDGTNMQDSEINTTHESETKDLSNPQESAPIILRFNTFDEIIELVSVTNGTPEEISKYINEKYSLVSENDLKKVASIISEFSLPTIKSGERVTFLGGSYYANRNELNIYYRVNNVTYCFMYRVNETPDNMKDAPVLKNVVFGSDKIDFYDGDGSFIGLKYIDGVEIVVEVKTEKASEICFDDFEFTKIQADKSE